MQIRLAVVDGHALIRYGLRELAAHQPDIEIAAECDSAQEALAVITETQPDVVTLAAALRDGDGLQLVRDVRGRFERLGIVVLAFLELDDVLFRALDAGASAFVAKSAPVDEVLAAIRHAAVAPSSFTASGLAGALSRQRAVREGLALSRRETEVLSLLRDGLSIPAIAGAMLISHSTAKTYVTRLYDKLGASNRAEALMTAMHYGLIRYEQQSRAGSKMMKGPAGATGSPATGSPGATALAPPGVGALTRASPHRLQPVTR